SGWGRTAWGAIRPRPRAAVIDVRPFSPWKLPEPWTPRTRPPLLGKRRNRVFHSSHRPHSEKRSDHLSNGSGQITCQQQRDGHWSLVIGHWSLVIGRRPTTNDKRLTTNDQAFPPPSPNRPRRRC